MKLRNPLPSLLGILLLGNCGLRAAEWSITVKAGEFDRTNTVVEFSVPKELFGNFTLRDNANSAWPLQIDGTGRAVYIEPQLGRGISKTYTLVPTEKLPDVITVDKTGTVVKVCAEPNRKPIFHYQSEPGPVPEGVLEAFKHGAYLHPVFTPAGHVVTADNPPDHLHQRGIFFAWTKTEFEGRHLDFWNMGKGEGGQLSGEIRYAALNRVRSGPVQGGITCRHRFLDRTSEPEKDVLSERWELTATRLPDAYLIDLVSTQTMTGQSPLKLPKYYYGGLGVRGSAAWDPVEKVAMLTSNGDDRKSGDNSKARWVQMGGLVEGQPAGITVLIHPTNFRFPQPLRLNPKNPQLCVAPSQEGDWEIEPGKPYVSRYRLMIADRAAKAEEIEREWNDYANPPVVELHHE
jgi:hypothetical protein